MSALRLVGALGAHAHVHEPDVPVDAGDALAVVAGGADDAGDVGAVAAVVVRVVVGVASGRGRDAADEVPALPVVDVAVAVVVDAVGALVAAMRVRALLAGVVPDAVLRGPGCRRRSPSPRPRRSRRRLPRVMFQASAASMSASAPMPVLPSIGWPVLFSAHCWRSCGSFGRHRPRVSATGQLCGAAYTFGLGVADLGPPAVGPRPLALTVVPRRSRSSSASGSASLRPERRVHGAARGRLAGGARAGVEADDHLAGARGPPA